MNQSRGHVVLGAERVGGAEGGFSAAGLQGADQVGGFGGHMQAGADAEAVERSLLLEAPPDALQHGHGLVRPLDTADAVVGK